MRTSVPDSGSSHVLKAFVSDVVLGHVSKTFVPDSVSSRVFKAFVSDGVARPSSLPGRADVVEPAAEPWAHGASDVPDVADAAAQQLTLFVMHNIAENISRTKKLAKKQG